MEEKAELLAKKLQRCGCLVTGVPNCQKGGYSLKEKLNGNLGAIGIVGDHGRPFCGFHFRVQ